MAQNDKIVIKGASENNLNGIDLEIPRDKLVVITGVSGSGKSSLAFKTIYAEGQRRYMESLSSYARQFLGQMEKPDVESISGLSPAIAIDQKTTSKNPRSTVGTVTEIYDYLRLLYARVGVPHCPNCGKEISAQTVDQMVDRIMSFPEGTKMMLLAPVVRGRKGEYVKLLDGFLKSGFARVKVDGQLYELTEEIPLEKNKKHTIDVVVDRIVVKPGAERRVTDSLETVLKLAGGLAKVEVNGLDEPILFSQNFACPDCGISIPEVTPRMFSFNNPYGACPECSGLGAITHFDEDLIIPDKNLSLAEGAVKIAGFNMNDLYGASKMEAIGKKYGFTMNTPYKDISPEGRQVILYGTNSEKVNFTMEGFSLSHSYSGVMNIVKKRYDETQSEAMKEYYEGYMTTHVCKACRGRRLRPESLAFTFGGKNIMEFTDLPIGKVGKFLDGVNLTGSSAVIAKPILKEIRARTSFLTSVGLDYLTMSRASGTLSGGESQRIRLATQIGSGLTGVLYVLDEPSIGLHQRDNDKLIATLKKLRDLGNTLLVVEHDEDTMRSADYIVDIGPGAGVNGGNVVAAGTPEEIMANENSLTGKYLSGKLKIDVPDTRKQGSGKFITVVGAKENNLKNIDVAFPLGVMTSVTGVSGSGKSSLVNSILAKWLLHDLNGAKDEGGKCTRIDGEENLDKVIVIDQTPIGRTPRSNPATYTGVFDMIRDLFAMTPDSRAKGYKSGRFSFNTKGGRCEACSGDGIVRIPMHFLPDIEVTCDVCGGARYNRETLAVHYKGKSIADVLDMTIAEADDFFSEIPRISRRIHTLNEVGLGYMKLGQPSTALSGGEAQRVKIATELAKRGTGKTLYILDEPTTGLHADDVKRLIDILKRLTDGGNTVVVIEHNLDIVKCSDYIIDLGPEGGEGGGTLVAAGTPEEIAECKKSYTGYYLKKLLSK